MTVCKSLLKLIFATTIRAKNKMYREGVAGIIERGNFYYLKAAKKIDHIRCVLGNKLFFHIQNERFRAALPFIEFSYFYDIYYPLQPPQHPHTLELKPCVCP